MIAWLFGGNWMNRCLKRLARTGLLALTLSSAWGTAQAYTVSISPSGNVSPHSTLTVTWPPQSQTNVAALIVQVSPNGPTSLTNTLINAASTGTLQITLPAGLNCGLNYSYRIHVSDLPDTSAEGGLGTWGNLANGDSPSFTILCPRQHGGALSAPASMARPKPGGNCPKGDRDVNGKCVASRDGER
jgi:hypothetical protein